MANEPKWDPVIWPIDLKKKMVVSSRKTVNHTLGFYRRQALALGEHTVAFHLLTNSPKGRTGKWAQGHQDGSLKKVLKLPQVIKKAPGGEVGFN